MAGKLMNVVVETGPGLVFVADGYAMPSSLTVHGEIAYGMERSDNLIVEVGVEIEKKRAVPRSVKVYSGRPRGVSAASLRDVVIRELAAAGCLQALRRAEMQPDGTVHLTDAIGGAIPGQGFEVAIGEAIAVVETLVGYVDEEKIRGSKAATEATT